MSEPLAPGAAEKLIQANKINPRSVYAELMRLYEKYDNCITDTERSQVSAEIQDIRTQAADWVILGLHELRKEMPHLLLRLFEEEIINAIEVKIKEKAL